MPNSVKAQIEKMENTLFCEADTLASLTNTSPNVIQKKPSIIFSTTYIKLNVLSSTAKVYQVRTEKSLACFILLSFITMGAVVEVTLTGFRGRNDAAVYIPAFYPTLQTTI